MKLTKLALRRDDTVPAGFQSALHLNCPCGRQVPVDPIAEPDVFSLCGCGQIYDSRGWLAELPDGWKPNASGIDDSRGVPLSTRLP